MIVDVQNSIGMGPVGWRAVRTLFWESAMKVKTNIRAGRQMEYDVPPSCCSGY